MLGSKLEARATKLRADAVRAATNFADSIEGDEDGGSLSDMSLQQHMARLNSEFCVALENFHAAVQRVLEVQFDDLASEVLEIEGSPYGQTAMRLGTSELDEFTGVTIPVKHSSGSLPTPPAWMNDAAKHLKDFHQFWGAGNGVKAASGSTGHQVVLKVGHAFGRKFKPWEAVKAADKIGRYAKFGGVTISIGLEAYGVYADERAAVKAEEARIARRRSTTQETVAQSDTIVTSVMRTIEADLDELFRPEFQRIDALANDIHGTRSSRTDRRGRLQAIQDRARTALGELAGMSAGATRALRH